MKRQWILYIMITAVLLGVSIHGSASCLADDANKRASDLAADYRTLEASAASFSMTAGDIIIEAHLPIDGTDKLTLSSSIDSLPLAAEAVIVSDHFHDTRWLHVSCPSGADSVYEDAFAIVSALAVISLDAIQLSLNTRWDTDTIYSTLEKQDLIRSFFASIEASTIASMADKRIVSASGFSHRLFSDAGTGEDRMNITASLCSGPSGGSTLWLGTPVLTVEY